MQTELGLHGAEVSSGRIIPPAYLLEVVSGTPLRLRVLLLVFNRTWEFGGPRSGSCVWLGWLLARVPVHRSRWLSRGLAPVERLFGSYEVTSCPHIRKMFACAPPVGAVSVKDPPDRARGGCVSFPTIGAYYVEASWSIVCL